ncbi:MAG: sodium:calcium antiporter [Pyrinomonadaceae bacterium]|nr:sodium:calcium antiporter [Pyrinomonadaceae bacterium]
MLVWIAIAIAGVALTLMASRKAVHYASDLAAGLSIPPFLIGITLVSIGTDIPEIANSIIASAAGHGDLNVGDSIGSVMTQITLVFGLLPFFAGTFSIHRRRTLMIGSFIIISLGLGAILVADGYLSRLDAAILIIAWAGFTALSWHFAPQLSEPVLPVPSNRNALNAFLVLSFLSLVGVGAGAFIKALIELSSAFGVHEYMISFFGASLGTSLPELFVDITALKRGKRDLAVGGIIGACLVDSTLSIGAGPFITPVAVTASLSIKGAIIAIVFTAMAILAVSLWKKHNRWTGAFMLLLYAMGYVIFIAR